MQPNKCAMAGKQDEITEDSWARRPKIRFYTITIMMEWTGVVF
jgi:hypothetical protein